MLHVTHIVRVDIPVHDRDEAIAFYTEILGFTHVVESGGWRSPHRAVASRSR